MKTFERLNKNEMKMIVGGYEEELEDGGGSGCAKDKNGLCGANCQRPSGAADKCRINGSSNCTCGGV